MPSGYGHGETLILPCDRQLRGHRQSCDRRQLDVRSRERKRSRYRDFVSRRRAAWSERIGRQPANTTVVFQLAPGPSLLSRFVDHCAFAKQRFAVESCVMRWRAAKSGDRFKHLVAPAFDNRLASTWPCKCFAAISGRNGFMRGSRATMSVFHWRMMLSENRRHSPRDSLRVAGAE